jgi:ketosteroid isomerase-like protein
MSEEQSVEARLRRLEDREAIKELIARYGLVMDDRDMANMPDLFTPDARIRSLDGVMDARGRDAVIDLYRGRFEVLGPSNHFTHDKIIRFGDDPDLAHGTVLSHAEMNRKGQPMLAAIRYADTYARHDGEWRFAERVFAFFYYVATAEYLDALGSGLGTRMRAYEEHGPADIPEQLASWQNYYGGGEGS